MNSLRLWIVLGLILASSALILSSLDAPFYTDAYYYYNAGEKLATGKGLSDAYLWMYINAPDEIPAESHRYWMPLASLVSALPMFIFGSGYGIAQMSLIPFWLGIGGLGLWLAQYLSEKSRIIWVAGLSLVFSGFYFPFWLASDTFGIFGLAGAGALVLMGLGLERDNWRLWAGAGICAAFAHLARADGVLLVLVGVWVLILKKRIWDCLPLVGAYLLVMLPWFLRSYAVLGAPLPAGGLGTVFLRGYNDLFSYPPDWDLNYFLEWGAGNILKSRWEGILGAFQTWLAVEAMIIFAPFALAKLWQERRKTFFLPFMWYALGLHLAMSVVFTYPGIRGGLYHSSAALFPFWIVLGLQGLDEAVAWLAKKRRWNTRQAQSIFGIAVLAIPFYLALLAWSAQVNALKNQPDYPQYAALIPPEARIMVNDPAAWHYHTALVGVALPDSSLEIAHEIARQYCITHLILDKNVTDAFLPLLKGENPPVFLSLQHHLGEVRIYSFEGINDSC